MKAQPHKLYAFTSWGSGGYKGTYPSKKAATEQGKFLIENGFAFSYNIKKV